MSNQEIQIERALEANCRTLFGAMYDGPLDENTKIHTSIIWEKREISLVEAFLEEINRMLRKKTGKGGQNWADIIICFYGINPNDPVPKTEKQIGKVLQIETQNVSTQRRVALENLSKSALLAKFLYD